MEIIPFRGYHYDYAGIGKPAERLLAPPYDVISDRFKAELCSEPMNICNVMLGNSGDSYAEAAKAFKSWVSEGVLKRDDAEAYYAYEQTFRFEGRTYQRTGLVALARLGPLGESILPHERTHPKAKKDRLELLSAIKANIEQIFMIYGDRNDEIGETLSRIRQPFNEVVSFVDPDGVRHRLFRIVRTDDISSITSALDGKRALIADGHHRYETALAYSQEMDEKIGKGPHDYVLATFVNAHDPGLIMLPTHRLIHGLDEAKVDGLEDDLTGKFDVERVPDRPTLLERLSGQEGCNILGFWLPKREIGYLATLKTELCSHDPLDKLDVSVLHKLVLEEILGITADMQERKEHIDFVKGTEQTLAEADKGDCQIVCLLNPANVPDIFDAAETGRMMPHKSTYFYPKLWSGLIVYLF